MKKLIALFAFVSLAACASKPVAEPDEHQKEASRMEEWIVAQPRTPASVDEDTFRAIKTFAFDTTVARIKAFEGGQFDKVCNAIGNARGNDTYAYYISLESLRGNNASASRLKSELGPFTYAALFKMDKQGLPYKLHDACVSHNRAAIDKTMRSIASVYAE